MVLTSEWTHDTGGWFTVVIILVVINSLVVLGLGKENWITLWIKRKALEEKSKINKLKSEDN